MAIKTFTTGEVLTASDTNTYLANSGLVFVAGATFTGAGTFDVTGFSSSYDFYELRMSINSQSSGCAVTGVAYQGGTARNSGYYGSTFFSMFNGTSGILNTRTNAANFYLVDCGTGPGGFVNCSLRGVGNGTFTINYQGFDTVNTRATTGSYISYAGVDSYDRIRFTSSTGNIGGSWSLMGVRKP